jgi:hypothetical protein
MPVCTILSLDCRVSVTGTSSVLSKLSNVNGSVKKAEASRSVLGVSIDWTSIEKDVLAPGTK